jgi:hypothetical protein
MNYINHWLVTIGFAGLLAVVGLVLGYLVRREARKHSADGSFREVHS